MPVFAGMEAMALSNDRVTCSMARAAQGNDAAFASSSRTSAKEGGSISPHRSSEYARKDVPASYRYQAAVFFGKRSIDRLNHEQLAAKLKALSRQLQAEQIKKNNYWISLKTARKKLDDYKRVFELISINKVPGLQRLLSNAHKEGWSPPKTAEKAQLAIDGKYHARNYTEFDKDLAILVYELGGGAALYALNKAPNLRITVGDVKISDILENIETLFRDVDPGEYGRVGHTLSQDEIAGDGRLCYLEDTDEIGGLCEHATSCLKTFKMGADLTSVEDAVRAIQAGEVHVGKEFSVAAFSRHAETDYSANQSC
ncbi:hypothetical protein B0H10DRAFT_2242551 [Mycena sp. CBHHK59/15]|nr:hypothetical protein B0H10DRAFT_2242551 [Mycena sp. CBHHK59/15]